MSEGFCVPIRFSYLYHVMRGKSILLLLLAATPLITCASFASGAGKTTKCDHAPPNDKIILVDNHANKAFSDIIRQHTYLNTEVFAEANAIIVESAQPNVKPFCVYAPIVFTITIPLEVNFERPPDPANLKPIGKPDTKRYFRWLFMRSGCKMS
jgi:hypothetical protein